MSWAIERNYIQYIAPSIIEWLRGQDEPGKAFAELWVECDYEITRDPSDEATQRAYAERFTERPEEVGGLIEVAKDIIETHGSMSNGAFDFQIGNMTIPVCSEDMFLEYYG